MSDFESILAQHQPGTLLEVLRDCGWFSCEQSLVREQLNLGEMVVVYKCESPAGFGDSLIRFHLIHPVHGKILLRFHPKEVARFLKSVPVTDVNGEKR